MAMDVLDTDAQVLEVWLHDIRWFPEYALNNRSEWLYTPTSARVLYRRQCLGSGGGEESFWGTYTNRASLKRRATLLTLGPQRFFDGEVDYAKRVNAAGLCSAHLCLHDEAECRSSSGMYNAAPHVTAQALFQHGDGTMYHSSSGHADLPRDPRLKGEL